MKSVRSVRLARWAAFAVLALAAFEACSSSTDTSVLAPAGPPVIALTTPPSTLACDDSIVVSLSLTNFTLRPPFNCGTTPQCGSLLVTLLETEDGTALASARAATADVEFDLTDLVSPKMADGPTLSQVHFIKAELYNDSLIPLPVPAGGTGSVVVPVTLTPPVTSCIGGSAGAGAGGAAGAAAGAAGESAAGASEGGASGASEGGAGGLGGSPAEAGAGGATAAAGATF